MNAPRIPELDAFTAERLLEGAPTGTPEVLGPLTGVLDALRSPAQPHELAACGSVVSAMTAATSTSAATTTAGPVLGRFSRRAAALALAGVVAAGGVAAAATGTIDSVLGGEDPVVLEEPIPNDELLPVACDDATSHGEFVSSAAQSTESGPGKGAAVSEAAQSDCGKPEKDEEPAGEEPVVPEDVVEVEAPLEVEPEGEEPDPCADADNHGEYVSGVAHDTPSGPDKGAAVSEAAQSDCGKAESGDEAIAEAEDVDDDADDDDERAEREGDDDGDEPEGDDDEGDEIETPGPSIPGKSANPNAGGANPNAGGANENAGRNGK